MSPMLLAGDILTDLGINFKVVAVQGALFLLTFFILKKLLFERLLAHMTARELDAEARTKGIREATAEGDRLAKEYDGKIQQVDKEAYERLSASLKETLDAKGRVVAEAQAKAAAEIRAAAEAVAADKARAMETLRSDVAELSAQAAGRAIGVPLEPSELDAAVKAVLAERPR